MIAGESIANSGNVSTCTKTKKTDVPPGIMIVNDFKQ